LLVRTSVPLAGPAPKIAVRAFPSMSVSFASIPGDGTVSVELTNTMKESFTATGGLSGVTVMVTVAVAEVLTPSVARYVKVSVPANPFVAV
jgi:hypothetical protein